jgi:hypothetical protein
MFSFFFYGVRFTSMKSSTNHLPHPPTKWGLGYDLINIITRDPKKGMQVKQLFKS